MSKPSANALLIALTLTALSAVACKQANPLFDPNLPAPGENCVRGAEVTDSFNTLSTPTSIDVLFVVSNSPTSEAMQRRLSSAMPSFVQSLRSQGLDFQIGVVSADATNPMSAGQLRTGGAGIAGCDNAPIIVTDEMGDDAALFATCNVFLGSSGNALQEHFKATEIALTSRASQPVSAGGNAGFLRTEAGLAIVYASERDDCSNTATDLTGAPDIPTACQWRRDTLSSAISLAETLYSLKPLGAHIAVGVLGADGGPNVNPPDILSPACKDAGNAAIYPTSRLVQLIELLHPLSHFESACSGSYAGSLRRIAENVAAPQPVVLCAENRLAEAPIGVTLIDKDEEIDLSQGQSGYVYLGRTNTCENGAVSISPFAVTNDTKAIEVRYCGL